MIDWKWSQLLGRADPDVTADAAASAVREKRVLITGAGGSIGFGLAQSALRGEPELLILADSSEFALYESHRQLTAGLDERVAIIPVLGDILDRGLLRQVLGRYRPDLIFHAAAYKHLSLLEQNPIAAIRNNALGTWTLVQTAIELGGCNLILLSTDKAVRPQSVMGVSKRIAELIVLAQAQAGLRGNVVRLSNVLDSSGSVAPLFADQLRKGQALTITDPKARRFMMTSNEASGTLLQGATLGVAGKVIVPRLGEAIAIVDLARHMVAHYEQLEAAPSGNAKPTEIKWIGLQPGEKLEESLTWADEVAWQPGTPGVSVYSSPCPELSVLTTRMFELEKAVEAFDLKAVHAAVHTMVPE